MKDAVYYPARDVGGFGVVFGGMWTAYDGSPEVTVHLFISEVTTNYGRWSNATYDAFYYKLLREKGEKAGGMMDDESVQNYCSG